MIAERCWYSAGDIARVAKYLEIVRQIRSNGAAKDLMCIPLIHAAAFEPLIANVTLMAHYFYRSVARAGFIVGLARTKAVDSGIPMK
jgi:hypothetical protein